MLVMKFSVYNQRLRRITSGIIPSNAYGKLKFQFDFRTNDWDAAEIKTANFYYNGENYPIELDEHNQCFVPKDVIYSPSFKVSVCGGDIVTNTIKILVDEAEGNSPSYGGSTSNVIFVPSISEDGVLSWSNNGGLNNPPSIDLTPFGDQDLNTFDAGEIIERS